MIRYTDIGIYQSISFEYEESTYEIRVSIVSTDIGLTMTVSFYHIYSFTDVINAPTYKTPRTQLHSDKIDQCTYTYPIDFIHDKNDQIRNCLLDSIEQFQTKFNINFSQNLKSIGIDKFIEIISDKI